MTKLSKTIAVLSVLAASLLFTAPTFAQTVGRTNIPPSATFAWSATVTNSAYPSAASYSGYNLYWGPASTVYTNFVFVPGYTNTTVKVTNIFRGGTYFFNITSLGTNGLESLYDGEVSATVTPLPPAPSLQQPVVQ